MRAPADPAALQRPRVTGNARLAGVIGWPVAHSLSPLIHGHWLAQHDIDGAYLPLAIAPEDFEACLAALPRMGFRGFNLTVPHKERILPFLTSITPQAERLGAVNTVHISQDGALHGSNSDGYGYIESLGEAVPDWRNTVKTACILGSGGAARAIAFALVEAGVGRLVICNRTRARADGLARILQDAGATCDTADMPPAAAVLSDTDLLINTTSLGMAGQPPLGISLEGLPGHALVSDIVYNPLRTDLLQAAERRGLTPVEGLGMLLHQARAGFELWFGEPVTVTADLRALALSALGQSVNRTP